MTIYQIRNWTTTYENNRSRAYKNCKFVCVPNNQDKEGMVRILAEPEGVALYGIWCLMLGAASAHPVRDGWLTSDGTPTGTPWTAEYLALRWRTDEEKVARLLAILSSNSVGWIEVRETRSEVQEKRSVLPESCDEIAFEAQTPETVQAIEPELEPELELEEEEGPPPVNFRSQAREVFDHWVKVFQKDPNRSTFKASSKRYRKVIARLQDGKTVEELKRAVDGCHSDQWWRETGNHDLFKICESDEWVERFADMAPAAPATITDEERERRRIICERRRAQ
jgi:hypothetical protein